MEVLRCTDCKQQNEAGRAREAPKRKRFKETRARLYIIRQCIYKLLCWHEHGDWSTTPPELAHMSKCYHKRILSPSLVYMQFSTWKNVRFCIMSWKIYPCIQITNTWSFRWNTMQMTGIQGLRCKLGNVLIMFMASKYRSLCICFIIVCVVKPSCKILSNIAF